MDEISILERIIQEDGSCTWANPSVCRRCPFGNLIRSESGGFISCIEAIGIDGLSEEEADAKYKKAATEKLADLVIQRAIEEE